MGTVMSFSDHALTLITLASLFILGLAIEHAVVSCFSWQNWSVPIQHLAVGFCTMFAVSGNDPGLRVSLGTQPDICRLV
jgi:hypothetical protein